MLMQAPPTGYSAGCVVRKKLVYLEELRRRGPDFGEFLQIPPNQERQIVLVQVPNTLPTQSLVVPSWSPSMT